MADPTGLPVSEDDLFDHLPPRSNKIRKPPPITPKRFNKFFTPRTTRSGTGHGASGRQLRDITRNAVNRKKATPRRTVVFSDTNVADSENFVTPKHRSDKKRKHLPSPESSPIQPSPSKKARSCIRAVNFDIAEDEDEVASDAETTILEESDEDEEEEDEVEVYREPIRRAPISSTSGRLLTRTFGGRCGVGRGKIYDHCGDWRDQTANFYAKPDEVYSFDADIPFCAASCNTNSLVAIGDEDGTVAFLETANASTPPFDTAHVKFRPHTNAVMDLTFSSDDLLLATASGDQTSHVIDVKTQQSVFILGGSTGHQSSVKQVRFQPGNDDVVVSSARDGTVQIWDLRVNGSKGAIRNLIGFDGQSTVQESNCLCIGPWNSITGAHAERLTVKLWDIRGRYNRRAVPIATTRQPESHSKHRHFGINSLSLNGNGSRLFALSRDNTIYAYSTSHLVLGHAPELLVTNSEKRKFASPDKEGLGPLYGFRHPRLHATSFWVKTSVRKARGDKEEMLAVGSSDGSPILFPTDETMLKRTVAESSSRPSTSDSTFAGPRSILRRNMHSFHARMNDTVPIYDRGTPLVRGHSKEVTGLTWTSEGELVTIGDDYTARCWREDREAARDLRIGGEVEGRRWNCGWADVGGDYDDDE
ncbi:putative wd domain protein [Diplodia seriata]|uniref:Putative wd domain protein n=1 Tax=Diplodia seriata TaxID=420778 RepID=A0A0G2EQZ8_9PEZI|nr:putative wd domain protein [Diplodia seriata]